jgi:hypothetical protein
MRVFLLLSLVRRGSPNVEDSGATFSCRLRLINCSKQAAGLSVPSVPASPIRNTNSPHYVRRPEHRAPSLLCGMDFRRCRDGGRGRVCRSRLERNYGWCARSEAESCRFEQHRPYLKRGCRLRWAPGRWVQLHWSGPRGCLGHVWVLRRIGWRDTRGYWLVIVRLE